MKKSSEGGSLPENAIAKKALDSLRQIEEETAKQKAQQLDGLREAIGNIDSRIRELEVQRQQVLDTMSRITGKPAPSARRPRSDHSEVRERVVRWLTGHAGTWYHSSELQTEFPELQEVVSVAMFLKKPIEEGTVKVDKTGGNRNTRYTAAA